MIHLKEGQLHCAKDIFVYDLSIYKEIIPAWIRVNNRYFVLDLPINHKEKLPSIYHSLLNRDLQGIFAFLDSFGKVLFYENTFYFNFQTLIQNRILRLCLYIDKMYFSKKERSLIKKKYLFC